MRQSGVRERINGLLGKSDRTDEETAELRSLTEEGTRLETEYRAAVVAEPETEASGGEAVEVRMLQGLARVGAYVAAAVTGQGLRGAEAEYAEARGCPGLMPLDLLGPAETRTEARAVTPGPSDETVTSTRPTVPYAFERTDAAALGVTMPVVAPGEAHFPALTTAPPATPKAEDGAADATAAAFTLTKRTPGRITGQFVVRVEDVALFPSMETDLRRAITAAIADRLDKEVINGDGSSPNLTGLFNVATDVAAAARWRRSPTTAGRRSGSWSPATRTAAWRWPAATRATCRATAAIETRDGAGIVKGSLPLHPEIEPKCRSGGTRRWGEVATPADTLAYLSNVKKVLGKVRARSICEGRTASVAHAAVHEDSRIERSPA